MASRVKPSRSPAPPALSGPILLSPRAAQHIGTAWQAFQMAVSGVAAGLELDMQVYGFDVEGMRFIPRNLGPVAVNQPSETPGEAE